MIKVLAGFITLVATSMTAVAAFDRGGTMVDKTLLVAMSVVIVLAVHLLPAISRRPIAWLVWSGCLVCAVYGHLTFLTHANLRAGQALAQQSALAVGTENQIKTVREALEQIKARSVSEITIQLSQESDRRVRSALREELIEAKKGEQLRDLLISLSKESTTAQIDGAADPVTAKLAAFLGVTDGTIAVVVGLTFSMLMELIGALVWVEALRPSTQKERAITTPVTCTTPVATQGKAATEILAKSNATTQDEGNATQAVTARTTTQESNATTPATHDATTAQSSEATTATPVVTFEESIGATQHLSSGKTDPEDEHLDTIRSAIQSGKCKATVNGIREFLGCSQTRAVELRRAVTA